jgi:predicted nucleic acid-binding protein
MTSVLVDSNVLLDVMTGDPHWSDWSAAAIERTADRHRLAINAVIYAEVSIRYSRIEDLEAALPKGLIDREAIPFEAAFLAGKSFLAYRQRGGTRRSPLPDFFVGAHAAVAGYRLITRDAARYRTYFPGLDLISPDGRADSTAQDGEITDI